MIGEIFQELFYRPIFNLLMLFVYFLPGHELGIAIIFLTGFIRLILHPLNIKALKDQKTLAELQPLMIEVQKKYRNDKRKLTQEALKIFQERKINPFRGILLSFLQLPILAALFFVFRDIGSGIRKEMFNNLYFFVPRPEKISPFLLGFLDLRKSFLITANNQTTFYWLGLPLIFLTIMTTFLQMRYSQPKTEINFKTPSKIFQKGTLNFLLFFSFFVILFFPLAISLYWLVTSLFSLMQQRLVFKSKKDER